MNNLDKRLHSQPLVEKEDAFLATYTQTQLNFFSLIAHFSFRTQTHDWKQRSQKGATSNVTNSDILSLTTEDERVNNTHDCKDRYNQDFYARLICLNFVLLEVVLVHTKGCLRWRPNLISLSYHWI